MNEKRKNDDAENSTGRAKKKVRLQAARTIAVQPVASGSRQYAAPEFSSPPKASTPRPLPGSLDVEKFVEARAFEIDAMRSAMKTAAASSTQRAWQALPRHLRRRAASHDVRRVPLRLRDKARAEMDPIRKKVLGRSKPQRGKNKQISRTEAFARRQKDKTWLETHIWHAKRMRMENMWGYRLAVHPTEKAFRPSHRASVHGSILHDASYFALVELKGPEDVLSRTLKYCCDPQGVSPGAKRFVAGSRVFETHIYTPEMYPYGLIAPVSILWRPEAIVGGGGGNSDPKKNTNHNGGGKGKGKGKADALASSENTGPEARVVWIRCHPAAYETLLEVLQRCASRVLNEIKQSWSGVDPMPLLEIEIADLRGQVNVFEIIGPKANQVIKGAFSPASTGKTEEFIKFWSSLGNLQSSGSLPRGMVIGFTVNDPRLKFPPKNAKLEPLNATHLSPAVSVFPSSALARSDIWEESTRSALKVPRYKKKDIDERKSKNLVPGTPLTPQRQDDRIPVLLIQRSIDTPSAINATGVVQSQPSEALHGWTLVFPAGWGMPFLSALTYTGTRVGGQRERATQSFEAGSLFFPRDYPGTALYEKEETKREGEEKARWERTPKAKRANFEKLGTRSAWRADWEVVLGLKGCEEAGRDEVLVTTQREDPAEDAIQTDEVEVCVPAADETNAASKGSNIEKPWLLRGPLLSRLVAHPNPAATLLEELNKLRISRGEQPFDVTSGHSLAQAALVSVRLRMCGRGVLKDLAMIYIMEDKDVRRWQQLLKSKDRSVLGPSEVEDELSTATPPQEKIIGYVTAGNFSLSRGEGYSIGAVSALQLFELLRQTHRLGEGGTKTPVPLVSMRNRDGLKCRAAFLELMDA